MSILYKNAINVKVVLFRKNSNEEDGDDSVVQQILFSPTFLSNFVDLSVTLEPGERLKVPEKSYFDILKGMSKLSLHV